MYIQLHFNAIKTVNSDKMTRSENPNSKNISELRKFPSTLGQFVILELNDRG